MGSHSEAAPGCTTLQTPNQPVTCHRIKWKLAKGAATWHTWATKSVPCSQCRPVPVPVTPKELETSKSLSASPAPIYHQSKLEAGFPGCGQTSANHYMPRKVDETGWRNPQSLCKRPTLQLSVPYLLERSIRELTVRSKAPQRISASQGVLCLKTSEAVSPVPMAL